MKEHVIRFVIIVERNTIVCGSVGVEISEPFYQLKMMD